MPMPFAPKIVYGVTTLLLQESSGIWVPDRFTQGGSSESAGGVPETFVVRKDGLLTLPLRFMENELATVVAWIDWCHANGSLGWFTFWPDQNKPGLSFQAWLISPKVGAKWGIQRASGYVKALELPTELRTRTVGQLFDIPIL